MSHQSDPTGRLRTAGQRCELPTGTLVYLATPGGACTALRVGPAGGDLWLPDGADFWSVGAGGRRPRLPAAPAGAPIPTPTTAAVGFRPTPACAWCGGPVPHRAHPGGEEKQCCGRPCQRALAAARRAPPRRCPACGAVA